jgi:hypothetical protein
MATSQQNRKKILDVKKKRQKKQKRGQTKNNTDVSLNYTF